MSAASSTKPLVADPDAIGRFVSALFCYADADTFLSLRTFDQVDRGKPPVLIEGVGAGDLARVTKRAVRAATMAAQHRAPAVFAPPVATFTNGRTARTEDLANGVALSVEVDQGDAQAKRRQLEHLIGPATLVVASGGEWSDPETGELHPKLHLHWRLSEPTRTLEDHRRLQDARWLAAVLVGADRSAAPSAHPLRWPGSWNRKQAPRMARIVGGAETAEVHLDAALELLQGAVEASGLGKPDDGPRASGEPQAPLPLIASALAVLPNADVPWDEWVRIGMACWRATGGSAEGLALWAEWSTKSGKHVEEACAERWRHYATSPPARIGAGTIFHLARLAGWVRPSRPARAEQSPGVEEPVPPGAEPEPEEDPASEAEPESDVAAEIARLAGLPALEFAAQRRAAASRLRLTVRDLQGAVAKHRKRAFREREEAQRERQRGEAGATVWPPGFRMEPHGLTYVGESDDAVPLVIAGRFEVMGEHRTGAGHEWGLLLRWSDRDDRRHSWPMPRRLLTSEYGQLEGELASRGLHVGTTPEARAQLRVALSEVETGDRIHAVTRAGWHAPGGGAAGYVLPSGEAVGATAEPLALLNPAEDAERRCARAGTAEGWRDQVAALAQGNALAVFCIAFALAGPLLELAGEDGAGAHVYGPSKRGKTVALRLAASVWGPADKGGALRDWRSTGNALEAAAAEATDGLLALDEMAQADPHAVVEAAYGLLNGAGKGRLRADATTRQRRSWRVAVLSNGEADLSAMAQKAGQRVPPGAETRMPSIPLPALPWPELHGRSDFGALCADLVDATRREHGTAGPAFVAWIAAQRAADPDHLPRLIAQLRDGFLARYVPDGADQQPREVARRLALVAAAGELGVEAGVLPWRDGEATRAAGAMFRAWLNQRGGAGSGEDAAHLTAVRLFVVQHGASRMQVLAINMATNQLEEVNDPTRPVVNRCGWRRRTPDGDTVYMFPRETWKAQVCDGLDPTAVARTLFRAGHLVVGEAGNLARKERIPGMATPRLYVVRSSILDDADALDVAA